MANFLYNGVELPDINEVWTDELKAQYPYAVLYITSANYVFLYCTRDRWYNDDVGGEGLATSGYLDAGDITPTMRFKFVDSAWGSATPGTVQTMVRELHWTSHDILNVSDNSVYFAASDPVDPNAPTDPIPEYMLYNGVELPNIDKVWTDKETFPYAFIIFFAEYNVHTVFLCKNQLITNRSLSYIHGVGGTLYYDAYDVNETKDGFVEYQLNGADGGVGLDDDNVLIWSSDDIVSERDMTTVMYEGSDPVPVGGGDNEPNTVDFTITYQSAYGSATESKTVTVNEGESYVLTDDDIIALEAEGYLFCGWSVNGEIISAGYAITADLVLVAVWESDVPEVLKQLVRAYKAGFAAAKALYGRW